MKTKSDTIMEYIAYADYMERQGFVPMSCAEWVEMTKEDQKLKLRLVQIGD